MKKYLIAILVFLVIAFEGYSQKNSTDTLCLPIKEGIAALQAKDSLEIMKREIQAKDHKVDTLLLGKSISDSLVSMYRRLGDKNDLLIENQKKQISALELQKNDFSIYSAGLKQDLKKQKWLTIKLAGGSAIVIGGLLYLLVHR